MNSKYIEKTAEFEGFKSQVYDCPAGYKTIGHGHNLEADGLDRKIVDILFGAYGDNVAYTVAKDAAKALLEDDLLWGAEGAKAWAENFWDDLSENRKYIIIDMCFNMGLGTLKEFRNFRRALVERNYSKAADEMIDSKWYNQVGVRSEFLVKLMRTDSWME